MLPPPLPTDSLTLTILRLRAEHFREAYWRYRGGPTFEDFLRYLVHAADAMDAEAQKLAAELADLNQRLRDP